MASPRNRNRKARTTIPSPVEMRAIREAQEQARKDRELHEEAEGKKIENWGIPDRHKGMGPTGPVMTDVQIKRDAAGRPRGAWRSNPFKLLAEGKSPTLTEEESDAGMRLMAVYAVSKGLDGAPERKIWMSVEGGDPDAWGREDRKIAAIRRYAAALDYICPSGREPNASRRIVEALMVALVEEDRPVSWRGIVERVTGATNPVAQATRMKEASEALAEYFRQEQRRAA